MTRPTAFAIPLLAATLLFAVVPFLTPFNGFAPDSFPVPQNDPPGQPAGWAFSIWGVIYLWLIVSTAYGVLKRRDDPAWAPARPWALASLAIGVPWLPVAGVSPVAAFVMIWAMLLTALVALAQAPQSDRWLFRAPLGLYAGWLTAASWVSVALNGAGFGIFFGEVTWAVVAILGAFAMSVATLMRLPRVPEFAVAVIWALTGVAVKNLDGSLPVSVLAGIGALALVPLAVRNWRMT